MVKQLRPVIHIGGHKYETGEAMTCDDCGSKVLPYYLFRVGLVTICLCDKCYEKGKVK